MLALVPGADARQDRNRNHRGDCEPGETALALRKVIHAASNGPMHCPRFRPLENGLRQTVTAAEARRAMRDDSG